MWPVHCSWALIKDQEEGIRARSLIILEKGVVPWAILPLQFASRSQQSPEFPQIVAGAGPVSVTAVGPLGAGRKEGGSWESSDVVKYGGYSFPHLLLSLSHYRCLENRGDQEWEFSWNLRKAFKILVENFNCKKNPDYFAYHLPECNVHQLTFIFVFSAESYLLPMSFLPVKISVPACVCSEVKQQDKSSRATSFLISLIMAKMSLLSSGVGGSWTE